MGLEVNKNTNIVSLVTLGVVLLQAVWVFGYRDAEIAGKFNEAKNHRAVIEKKVELSTADRIHKATVEQMFITRDERIIDLKDRLERIDSRVESTNQLLTQLIKEMKGK